MKYISLIIPVAFLVLFAGLAFSQPETVNRLAGTQWQLLTFNGEPVIAGTTITLDFADGERAGGSAGCNIYGAGYEVEGDAIRFEPPFRTEMACMADGVMQQEDAYLTALASATSYTLTAEQLVIETEDGQLVFVRQGTLLHEWKLVSLGGEPVVADSLVTITFDDEGRAMGSSGCNQYSTTYETDGDSIRFGVGVSTLRACLSDELNAQEAAYLAALGSAVRYILRDDTLIIEYGDGETLVFNRLLSLDNSAWELTTFVESDTASSLFADTQITLVFDDDSRLSGTGGCNRYGAVYTVDGDTITVERITSTRRACEPAVMAQEAQYFALLGSAVSYELSSRSLIIRTADGRELVFAPLIDEMGETGETME